MTKRAACLPPPPVGKSATLHFHTLTPDETFYRVYRGADPAQFRITSTNNRLGHASIDTTARYAQANLETKRRALERIKSPTQGRYSPPWRHDADLLQWLDSL